MPSWADFDPGYPVVPPGYNLNNEGEYEVITTTSQAALTRNAEELAGRIKAASGKLTVNAQSSDLIVALNNRLRFAVTRNAAGQYDITDRLTTNNLLLLAIPAVLLVVILANR